MTIRFNIQSERETEAFASLLHDVLPKHAIVGLDGTLGAGKTRLVRAFAAASGVPEETVTSPTFTLWQTYHGERVIHHLDAYRVRDEDEFDALGVEDCFEAEATTFVEWANRVETCLPSTSRVNIQIEVLSDCERYVSVSASSEIESALRTGAAAIQIQCD